MPKAQHSCTPWSKLRSKESLIGLYVGFGRQGRLSNSESILSKSLNDGRARESDDQHCVMMLAILGSTSDGNGSC